MLFVRRDFVARYKQTILGPFWFILNPLISTLDVHPGFCRDCKNTNRRSTSAIVLSLRDCCMELFCIMLKWHIFHIFNQCRYIWQSLFSPACFTNISNNFIDGTAGDPIITAYGFYDLLYFTGYDIQINWHMLYIPLLIINLALLGLGFGIIFSALTTKYRDLSNLMSFGVQLWMYITPVIYPSSAVPEKYRIFVYINPVAPLVEAFKYGLIGAGEFNPGRLLYSVVFTLILLFVGVILFNRTEQNFMDTV